MFGMLWRRKRQYATIDTKEQDPVTADPASVIFDYLASRLTAAGLILKPGVIHKRYKDNHMVFSDSYLNGVICGMCKAVISKSGIASPDEAEQHRHLIALWYATVMKLLGEQMGESVVMRGKINLVMPFDAVQEVDPRFVKGVLDGGNEALTVLAGQRPSRSFLDRKTR